MFLLSISRVFVGLTLYYDMSVYRYSMGSHPCWAISIQFYVLKLARYLQQVGVVSVYTGFSKYINPTCIEIAEILLKVY